MMLVAFRLEFIGKIYILQVPDMMLDDDNGLLHLMRDELIRVLELQG